MNDTVGFQMREFKNLLADAEFNLVASRSAQAAVLKAVKAGETVVDLTNPNPEGDGTDPDGGGSGGSGNGGGTQGGGSGNNGTSDPSAGSGTETKYTLTVTSNDANMGTVSGAGQYAKDTQATIKATPKSGYLFDQWSDGNKNAERTVTVSRDNMSLVATFYQEGTQRPSEVEPELPPAE